MKHCFVRQHNTKASFKRIEQFTKVRYPQDHVIPWICFNNIISFRKYDPLGRLTLSIGHLYLAEEKIYDKKSIVLFRAPYVKHLMFHIEWKRYLYQT